MFCRHFQEEGLQIRGQQGSVGQRPILNPAAFQREDSEILAHIIVSLKGFPGDVRPGEPVEA
jgi:hypothetical protein